MKIPYGRQCVDEDDIAAVAECLRSEYLTTGPMVERFERLVAEAVGATRAVAFANGSAALLAAAFALDLGPGDEAIVTPMTFVATANCILARGATPVFADVLPDTLLIDPQKVKERLSPSTKAVFAVDYAGQPCDYAALRELASPRGLAVVADSCHALGATRDGASPAEMADMAVYSFHPVKHITTGEGGMLVARDPEREELARIFRNHGIRADARQRERANAYAYDVEYLSSNYRLSDINCALGVSQMGKLPRFLARREEIASRYDAVFSGHERIRPLRREKGHANHLYVVRVPETMRDRVFYALREQGILVNAHYRPVHLFSLYKKTLGVGEGLCPVAEQAWREILSLPIHPSLTGEELEMTAAALKKAVEA